MSMGRKQDLIWRISGSSQSEFRYNFQFLLSMLIKFDRMLEIKAKEEEDGGESTIKLPPMEIARTFAVETIDYPRPLGFQYGIHRN